MTEKFDIFKNNTTLFRQDENGVNQDDAVLNDTAFLTAFSDTEDLLTVNVSQPIKRVMKFYNIDMGIPQTTVELDYDSMTAEQKGILDNFITSNSI